MKNITILLLILTTVSLMTFCAKSVKKDSVNINANEISSDKFAEKILPGNNVSESGVKDITTHSGQFDITMSGYRGEIFIGIAEDRFYGTIKFYNWGNGVPQPLTDLKISDDKIYFKRTIKTKEDLIKYGGTAFFDHDFYGIFTPDKKTIKGYYRFTGTQDNWEAVKK